MVKPLAIGILSAVMAYFVAVAAVSAQTPTTQPTTTPSPTEGQADQDQTPGAPSTGFGS